jgi:hypothetical protein
MASGHANRINRPNTWLHRPMLRREVLTCQPGAVHTWHEADVRADRLKVRGSSVKRRLNYRRGTSLDPRRQSYSPVAL